MAEVIGLDRERRGRWRAAWAGQYHAIERGIDRGLGALDRHRGVGRAVAVDEGETRQLMQRQRALVDGNGGLDNLGC